MNLSLIQTTLASWVASITSLPVYWRHTAVSSTWEENHVLCYIANVRSVPGESLLRTYNALAGAGEEIEYSVEGQRQFNLEIQCYSFSQIAGENAAHYTNLIRDRLRFPSAQIAFKVADIAFARILGSGYIAALQDMRDVSVSNLELLMNASFSADDTPIGYIETIKATSNFLGPDGNPVSEQFDGDIVVG
jgi:hypothetical protein